MARHLTIQSLDGNRQWPVPAPGAELTVDQVVAAHPEATHATFESADGDYRASIPLEMARRQGRLSVEADGSVRLRVEDGDTLCWNVKDVGTIRLTVGPESDSVPDNPSH